MLREVAIVWAVFCAAGLATAQPSANLEFEVASVKAWAGDTANRRAVGCHGGPGSADPTLFTCRDATLSSLVIMAYGINPFRLSAPGWMETSSFEVSARVPKGAAKAQLPVMVRKLLSDRFRLVVHRETRVVSRYLLFLAKDGPKFHHADTGLSVSTQSPPRLLGHDTNGYPILPTGWSGTAMSQGRARMQRPAITMEKFASLLSVYLGQLVVDGTGLQGLYDVSIYWSAEPPNPNGSMLPNADSGPTLIQALHDQLGLRVEARKGPVEFLVIDHAERVPTEN